MVRVHFICEEEAENLLVFEKFFASAELLVKGYGICTFVDASSSILQGSLHTGL